MPLMRPAVYQCLCLLVLALTLSFVAGLVTGAVSGMLLILSGIMGMTACALLGSDAYAEGLVDGWAQRGYEDNTEEEKP